MTQRRFSEAEVSAIFERALQAPTSGDALGGTPFEGMTLAELQQIGLEAGIPAESIALAALSVDRVGSPVSRSLLGIPLGVSRTVYLGRKMTDEEWEQFVVVLRDTFNARGTLRTDGSLRQWTNGNLQALLEPTASGHRIRLRTFKGGAPVLMMTGLGTVAFALSSLIGAAMSGTLGDRATIVAMTATALGGIGVFLSTAVRLPGWARLRARQMEEVSSRVALATTASDPAALPGSENG